MDIDQHEKGRALAMTMGKRNLRAVIGEGCVDFLPIGERSSDGARGPQFQPRDEWGRYVAYADLISDDRPTVVHSGDPDGALWWSESVDSLWA